ncbi:MULTISPECIES: chromosome segregation protein SMC [unclassified Mucilaginibacter]|uniref:chromosome segregation protein SMC n=1 Tax=unclassified Mucilaginibacter TaxID=2617802 RepID=UPI002AC8CA3B|nr:MULTISPECIES: chromosome segregation protein SMC [unclassified Mucilaginibacter]MEB0262478.1 chromosome segregation protein SMC [Mucilaginibacter sp. 10I4]MEB0279918.1 chromosome segregation protein SMC [Mucilaginibacter sp. 10B2]MEB0300064.1 chromosome segregation protein SMC [Mucilaginibacter sp. 5C4]WPX21876.1 chromosome segregation protein SMC [Mucilaginibacter sp. 5C4]
MQLTRLEIKGFKSFGDKITINFNEGVTAIVGPNGCGKSNVVDAIRWVLGEQSTRALRSEKMDNIIFNGTKSRKAANLAEVSLTFDNTKNVLPTDFSQVTLTRRLYRTGESEYRLNDVQCRLKDITDLFLDTGIGSDSYAIIELKMIDEIINNKEGSRRNLFEEASGISKYKLRKKQTFSKLKDTEADLERVEDLLFEIEKNLKTLENQAKKTERYYKLRDQYKSLSISLASFRIANFSKSLAEIEEKEQIQREQKLGIATQIDKLEATLQQNKLDSLTKEKNLSAQQKASNEFTARIRAYESERRVKNEQLKNQQDKESRLKEELERDNNQFKHVQYNIKRLNEEKLQEDENLQTITSRVAELKEAVDELRAQQAEARNELNELNSINGRLQNQVYKAEKDIDILNIQQQALEQESQRNMEDTTNKEAELSHFNKVVAELDNRVATLESEYDQTVEAENKLQEQVAETETELKTVTDSIAANGRKLDAKQNEYNLTKSLVDNLEGFPESIRFLKKNTNWAKTVTLFSDILFCKEEYRVAIENYLEPLMNHYVVNTYDEAIAAINLLSNSSKGRAQFFILDNYEAAPIKPSPEGRASEQKVSPTGGDLEGAPALSVVEVEERYMPLCNYLLKNVYLVNDATENDINGIQLPDGVVLIGKSGKFNKSKHTMAGGSVGLFEGKRIGRAKNLDNLLKEIKQAESRIQNFKNKSEELQSSLAAIKVSNKTNELRQQQYKLNQVNTELITVKTKQEQYQAFIENSLNRKQDIANKVAGIKNDIITLGPQLMELKEQKQAQAGLMLDKQQAFNELNEMVTVQSNTYNQENIRFHQQQNKVSGLLKDLDYRETQLEHLDVRIGQNNIELEKAKAAILENLQQTGDSDESLLEMYGQKEALEKGTAETEHEYYAWRATITESEKEVSKLRQRKDQTEALENELKDERNKLKLELNALRERLSVEFNVDINDLLEIDSTETSDEDEIRDKTEKMKRQLDDFGAINPMAIEAYNEMSERHTFIQTQKKDLAEAKASLLATIQEIDDTAKEKFMSAFTMVRENFIKVFRSLFNEEDSCDLILSNPDQPLESEIDIIARPKGKRPLSINLLSGGEKTLTAIAILFSLYLLKPAPFCIFDEVDAPLDDTNIDKFNNIIRKFSKESQFIIISHNKRTIACTDIIYGVTMVEQGISRVVPVDLREMAD